MISDRLYKLLRSKKTSEDEKTRLKKYFKEIRQIFDAQNYETASNLLEELLSHFDNIPHILQRFITKKILPNLNRLTQSLHDPKISCTSNHVENYYRQTLPRTNKKKYKTIQGLINYLKLKMQNGQQNTENITNTKQLDSPNKPKRHKEKNQNKFMEIL